MSLRRYIKSKRRILAKNKKTSSKQGSYILEAVIILPPFIIAMLLFMFVIPVISDCEEAIYISSDLMRAEQMKAHFVKEPASYPVVNIAQTKEKCKSFGVVKCNRYRYLYSKNKIDDRITYEGKGVFSHRNLLAAVSKIEFNYKVTGRAFTGKYQKGESLPEDAFLKKDKSEKVYIFPNWGKRYHNRNCPYLHPAAKMTVLTNGVKRKYKSCPLCGSKNARNGQMVFCFEKSGRVYHLGNCSTVDKYYIEIEKKEAIKKGYTPCEKCGG